MIPDPLLLTAGLTTVIVFGALFVIKRSPWLTTLTALCATIGSIALVEWSAATPLPGPPPVPFVLWAAEGDYSWCSPGRDDAPRTYVWMPTDEMMRDLREGAPLLVEAQLEELEDERQRSTDFTPTRYRWTRLEPEDAVKEE